jgi:hypothetical protein
MKVLLILTLLGKSSASGSTHTATVQAGYQLNGCAGAGPEFATAAYTYMGELE